MNSPCTKVCKIEQGRCTGCNRTLEQIAAWSTMTEQERKDALNWPDPDLPPINLWNAPKRGAGDK